MPLAYPFGHGLTYSAFNYSFAAPPAYLNSSGSGQLANVSVEVSVRNVGLRPAREVVQAYVRSTEPLTALRAFTKTPLLQPGEAVTVALSISPEAFQVFDYALGSMAAVRPRSEHVLLVGASSRDIRLSHAFV